MQARSLPLSQVRSSRMKRVKIVVVGAGVIGFSTAVCIAEALPLCAVTLVADQFSPDTTSDGAAGVMFVSQYPGMSCGNVTETLS